MPSCLTRMLASFAKDKTTTKADIEACCRIFLFGEDDGDFDPSKHPRKHGLFAKKGSGTSESKKDDDKPERKPEAPEQPKPDTQEATTANVDPPKNPVYGTNHPLGGGKSMLTSSSRMCTMRKPTGKPKKAKVSKQEYAQLSSHAMQYMTPQQRKDTKVVMEMGGNEYTFIKNDDYIITKIISVVNIPVRHRKG